MVYVPTASVHARLAVGPAFEEVTVVVLSLVYPSPPPRLWEYKQGTNSSTFNNLNLLASAVHSTQYTVHTLSYQLKYQTYSICHKKSALALVSPRRLPITLVPVPCVSLPPGATHTNFVPHRPHPPFFSIFDRPRRKRAKHHWRRRQQTTRLPRPRPAAAARARPLQLAALRRARTARGGET